jgi:NAD(P)-dependent dehydrogenase (short-subunit alcohol dehydrogenase family)
VISVGGLKPPAYQGFYAATKAALHALDQGHGRRMGLESGIRVNALAPGSYHSDMFDKSAKVLPGFTEGSMAATLQKRIAETDEIRRPGDVSRERYVELHHRHHADRRRRLPGAVSRGTQRQSPLR